MLDHDSQQELLVKITPSEERDGGLEPLVTEPEWWGDMKEVKKKGKKVETIFIKTWPSMMCILNSYMAIVKTFILKMTEPFSQNIGQRFSNFNMDDYWYYMEMTSHMVFCVCFQVGKFSLSNYTGASWEATPWLTHGTYILNKEHNRLTSSSPISAWPVSGFESNNIVAGREGFGDSESL